MKSKNKGYIVPVAIGVLVVASLGLLAVSWLSAPSKNDDTDRKQTVASTSDNMSAKSASDDATLDDDSASLDAQIKALDNSGADINTSFNDKSSI